MKVTCKKFLTVYPWQPSLCGWLVCGYDVVPTVWSRSKESKHWPLWLCFQSKRSVRPTTKQSC